MKKSDAVTLTNSWLDKAPKIDGDMVLKFVEEVLKMKPPFSSAQYQVQCRTEMEPDGLQWDLEED